jgi:hypothetical protein
MSAVARVLLAPLGFATATGVMFNYYVARSSLDLSATQRHKTALFIVVLVAAVCLVIAHFRYIDANPNRVAELASVIYGEAIRLKKSTCIKFRAHLNDAQIAYALIEVRDSVAHIRLVFWDEHFGLELPRGFEVEPNGHIVLCSDDSAWCDAPLVLLLEELLEYLHACEPCFDLLRQSD